MNQTNYYDHIQKETSKESRKSIRQYFSKTLYQNIVFVGVVMVVMYVVDSVGVYEHINFL